MKKIYLNEYNSSMGVLIDVNYYDNHVTKDSVHIPYEDLLTNYSEYLDKNKKYFIFCNGGIKSRKVVNILSFYGYDVTLIER